MSIKIWYTVSTKELGGKFASEVVRHWTHPLTHGSLPVWAGVFATANKAHVSVETAKREAEYGQMERDALCVSVIEDEPDEPVCRICGEEGHRWQGCGND